MNIFGLKIRLFSDTPITLEAIETWMVKWESLYRSSIDRGIPNIETQAFTSKESAELFAKQLRDARKLLGDTGWDVKVYKQKPPTNC